MKTENLKIFMGLGLMLALSGCSNKTPAIVSSTPQPTKVAQYINSTDSTLTQEIPLMQLTDPALYSYLQASSQQATSAQATNMLPEEKKKVGKLKTFNDNSEQGLSGTAQIISNDQGYLITINQFSYNGKCGNIYFGLSVANSPKNPIQTFPAFSGPLTDQTMSFQIPSNITLLQFDLLNIYCVSEENPISSVQFN